MHSQEGRRDTELWTVLVFDWSSLSRSSNSTRCSSKHCIEIFELALFCTHSFLAGLRALCVAVFDPVLPCCTSKTHFAWKSGHWVLVHLYNQLKEEGNFCGRNYCHQPVHSCRCWLVCRLRIVWEISWTMTESYYLKQVKLLRMESLANWPKLATVALLNFCSPRQLSFNRFGRPEFLLMSLALQCIVQL